MDQDSLRGGTMHMPSLVQRTGEVAKTRLVTREPDRASRRRRDTHPQTSLVKGMLCL